MELIKIGIYKIESPDNKIYIGASSNIVQRWRLYYSYNCEKQTKLYLSFIKHTVKNHKFDIIEECSIDLLKERERYWQDYYNVLEEGLNSTLTATKDKKGTACEEFKEKIRIINRETPQYHRIIQVFDLNGNLLNESVNASICSKKNNIATIRIYRILKGQVQCKGLILKYKDESEEEKYLRENCKTPFRNKSILQYSLEGEFLKEWDCIKDASEALNINREAIGSCIKGRSKTSGGFIWKYKL